jgi:hypothetical protein
MSVSPSNVRCGFSSNFVLANSIRIVGTFNFGSNPSQIMDALRELTYANPRPYRA